MPTRCKLPEAHARSESSLLGKPAEPRVGCLSGSGPRVSPVFSAAGQCRQVLRLLPGGANGEGASAASPDDILSPRIETPRLVLRRYEEGDFDAFYRMASDRGMFRYSERGPMTSDEVWTRLLRHAGHWSLLGYGVFAVEEKATGRYAGEAGLGQFRRGLGEPFDSCPEISWSIAPDLQGQGYAQEAAAAALRWFALREPGPTVCMIHHANAPSLRVAAKLGYRQYASLDYKGYPALLFERSEVAVRPQ